MSRAAPIRCVLFDVDGTLIDTWDLYIEAYLDTLETYLGRRLSLEELRELSPTSERRLLERAVTPARAAEAHDAFLDRYRTLHPSRYEGPYPGVPETLAALRKKGVELGVVTGKSRGAWEITRTHSKLGDFAVAVFDDDVAREKPAPDGLILALERLDVAPEEAIYVGDGVRDAEAARAAGLRFGAALWPKSERELPGFLRRVRAAGVWEELATPQDLLNAV